ncbi:MAG: sugar ABC transporter permease [Firmicutes bacterium]|jgi:multiple sugar transport system permease protein|nr:sugar ABC transporter permease [Bacillota bacterium]
MFATERRRRSAYLYLTPAALVFLVFTLGPAFFVLYISLFNWNFLNSALSTFVGLQNYTTLLTSSTFWHSLAISLYFVIGTVPVGLFLALVIAMALMNQFAGRGFVRLAVFSPYVTPVVATSIVWIWIFNPQFGLLNGLLHMAHLPELGWLQSQSWAMPGVIFYTLWHSLGFDVIIFMAGLSGISADLREAARIDGANRWQEFWSVTWPLLTPTTLFVLIITTIGSLQAFTQFFTMTAGGPMSATTTTSYLLYELAFLFYRTGPAAALAVLLFIIIAGLTALQMLLSQRRTYYQ